ncbi:MAG: hypothetical protein AAGJ31_05390, partial [Verrucomicrobiota bacterium]
VGRAVPSPLAEDGERGEGCGQGMGRWPAGRDELKLDPLRALCFAVVGARTGMGDLATLARRDVTPYLDVGRAGCPQPACGGWGAW